MIFDKSITLYNAYYDREKDLICYKRTYITGVHIEGSNSVRQGSKGSLNTQDNYCIYIPFNANTEGKEYISPYKFENLTDTEKDKYFTFNNDDKIVKGITDFNLTGVAHFSIKDLEQYVDEVLNITSIKKNDYGSEYMRHWKVGAK